VFERMLGPNARPETRRAVLSSVARMKPNAFQWILRQAMQFDGVALLRQNAAKIACLDAEGEENPALACAIRPDVPRLKMANVSHWMFLDDPAGFNQRLDQALATLFRAGAGPSGP
jgi:hypothetical protein